MPHGLHRAPERSAFDSPSLAGLSAGDFRLWPRKSFGFEHANTPITVGPYASGCWDLGRRGQRETVAVGKTGDTRKRARTGEPVASIARHVGVSESTAGKRARMVDRPSSRREGSQSEALAPYEGTIDSWLGDDRSNWRKRCHTSTRGVRQAPRRACLRRELLHRAVLREEAARGDGRGARPQGRRRLPDSELACRRVPGRPRGCGPRDLRRDHQGQAPNRHLPALQRGAHPGLLGGETSKRVCQGLRNVFEFAGGAPRRAVFDNATEVDRQVGSEAGFSGLFRRFAAHHGLGCALDNPYSGNEKGTADNKVICHRRNLFVPVPSFNDVRTFNGRLLKDCLDPGDGKRHHGLGTPEPGLFGEDKSAVSPLPRRRSNA